MAQAGYTPIQLYHSTTPAAVPTSGNLLAGELAINTADGKLYYEDSGGTVQILATKAGASGDVVGPASATDNAIVRFDLTTGKLIQNSGVTIDDSNNLTLPGQADLRFGDADSSNWVALQAPSTVASNVTFTLPAADGTANQVLTTNGSGALSFAAVSLTAGVTGTLPVANGGTGATTLTANNVILGNGTSAPLFVAPGSSGNVLTSNGTTWQSTTPAATGASKGQAIAFAMIFGL